MDSNAGEPHTLVILWGARGREDKEKEGKRKKRKELGKGERYRKGRESMKVKMRGKERRK